MSDSVNKPSHYAFSDIECIDYLRAIVPARSFIDHCRMSAIAYITRSPHKGSEVEDIDKAINYLTRARNEAEKAVEAMEGNHPAIPDSSDRKPVAIPAGWRELEPDEVPESTDMHEWMGGWFYRNDDATCEYKWHSSRHIRKIEHPNPSETPNSSKWIPKVGDKVRVNCPGRLATGDYGIIVEEKGGEYAVRMSNFTAVNLKPEHLELIEASS